ncbi:MAG: hypothetical protein ACKO34_03950 [Vampirovibrionales bacterium]
MAIENNSSLSLEDRVQRLEAALEPLIAFQLELEDSTEQRFDQIEQNFLTRTRELLEKAGKNAEERLEDSAKKITQHHTLMMTVVITGFFIVVVTLLAALIPWTMTTLNASQLEKVQQLESQLQALKHEQADTHPPKNALPKAHSGVR